MKKIGLACVTILAGLSLAGCNNLASQSHKTASSSSTTSTKVVKHHKTHKKAAKKDKQSSSSSNDSSQTATSSTSNQQSSNTQQGAAQSSNGGNDGQQQAQGKSQGEINRERGYDPNGAPLLPGQDHAAGSNPDGSPDAWVQGQINWAIQNGYMNPDGTNTPKGQAAEDEVERDSQPGMP